MTSNLDRGRGALLGLAVGDALGSPLEFKNRDEYPILTEMVGGGAFRLNPGEWTDDTSMAIALSESLLAHDGFNPHDLISRFANWYKHGEYSHNGRCFDIGGTTRKAINKYINNQSDPFCGSKYFLDSGNGSIMRLSPVALFGHNKTLPELVNIAVDQSRTTHASSECITCCAYFAMLLHMAINGMTKDQLFSAENNLKLMFYISTTDKISGPIATNLIDIFAGTWKIKKRNDIKSTGRALDTLEAALWCVFNTNSFEEAVVLAVNLADDADTVGAVTGQLAGALYGYSSIPERWLAVLSWRDRLLELSDKLLRGN